MKQLSLVKNQKLFYGGTLQSTRAGRQGPRPLSTRDTMHIVLKSSRAKGSLSFRTPANAARVREILQKFAARNAVRLLSVANAGNHVHIHLQLGTRHTYRAFIRAVTAAIAMSIGQKSRWSPGKEKFWDYRPFSRIVKGFKAALTVRDYLHVNQLEGLGLNQNEARNIVAWRISRGLFQAAQEAG